MLFNSNSITVSFSCQQYQCNEIEIFEDHHETLMSKRLKLPTCDYVKKVKQILDLYAIPVQN